VVGAVALALSGGGPHATGRNEWTGGATSKGDTKIPQEVTRSLRGGDEAEVEVAGAKMTFCWVPPGTAKLGSPTSEQGHQSDEAEHEYTSQGFWLAKYPVTQGQWKALMGNNPSYFTPAQEQVKKDGITDTSRFPVEDVYWDDPAHKEYSAQEFLRKMNASVTAPAAMGKGKFVLPHEDEWEYAARGGKGNKHPFYWGDRLNGDKANCRGTSPYGTDKPGDDKKRTTAVGDYAKAAPHPWGLCDMSGNVWQWCDNKYRSDEDSRVFRGGYWGGGATSCRPASRGGLDAGYLCGNIIGFRPCFRLD
jgi:formylglycine-generating enzyme required for sulfatase activity